MILVNILNIFKLKIKKDSLSIDYLFFKIKAISTAAIQTK